MKCILLFPILLTGEINYVAKFNKDDIRFRKIKGDDGVAYDLIEIKGTNFIEIPGEPSLPKGYINFIIPPNAIITKIEIKNIEKETLINEYNIYPTQPPRPISFKTNIKWIPPNPSIYSSDKIFPQQIVYYSHTGDMRGYRIATIVVHPIQYIPNKKKIIFNSKIEFIIKYRENKLPAPKTTQKSKEIFASIVKNMVVNKEMIEIWGPTPVKLSSQPIEYLIITQDSLANAFRPLADWKTKKGIPAKICSLSWIYANYTGIDAAERIRNFIKDVKTQWGVIYVLLGGQCDFENNQSIVPRRDVYYWTSGANFFSDEDTIPSDLYFSDLDDSWNADGDNVWGESTDGVNFYSDVFVGRAPVRTTAQVNTFVNKILTYEKNPPASATYYRRMLLPAGILDSQTDGTLPQEAISNITPTGWTDIKLYEINGNLSLPACRDTINTGIMFANLVGHGNQLGIHMYSGGAHPPYLNSDTVKVLTNGTRLGIFISSGCMCGAIDYVQGGDCFAEQFLLTPTGGGMASRMNSRYGWYSPGAMNFSDLVDTSFYHEIFIRNRKKLGVAHAVSKNNFVPLVQWNTPWPWILYTLNLFGDPELPLWTDIPDTLNVTHNSTILVGTSNFTVTVQRKTTATPIEGAYVCCLLKSNKAFWRGYTNSAGQITFTITAPVSDDTLFVTTTKQNYLPKETFALTTPAGTQLIVFSAFGEDSYIKLLWQTGIEINIHKWVIARAEKELFAYKEIAQIQPQGSISKYTYIDSNIVEDKEYWYKLGEMDINGNIKWHGPVKAKIEKKFFIDLTYIPNPVKEKIRIEYTVEGYKNGPPVFVNISLYNESGQLVQTILKEKKEPGKHFIHWSLNNLPSGKYFLQLKTNEKIIKKFILL